MPILAKFEKQPADEQDYDISFVDWLAALSDTAPGPNSVLATADPGITLSDVSLRDGVVKVWLSGGSDGTTYKVTVTLTTVNGRIKQVEIKVKVKES
ncbi:Phage protein [Polaromonas sp. CG9_12]|nr:Phage protein [Polaromonas sp. CG9_12]